MRNGAVQVWMFCWAPFVNSAEGVAAFTFREYTPQQQSACAADSSDRTNHRRSLVHPNRSGESVSFSCCRTAGLIHTSCIIQIICFPYVHFFLIEAEKES